MTDYGTDVSCITDIDPTFNKVSGRILLGQSLVRRLTTYRGALIDDGDYGTDVTEWINESVGPRDVRRLQMLIDAELTKDERIVSATSELSFVNGVLSLSVQLVDGEGPFTLTSDISAIGVESLSVQ